MKKFYFLFLFALIASIGNLYAAEKTVKYTFTSETWKAAAGDWTSIVPADAKYGAGPCASNSNNHPSAESPIAYTNIKKIDVEWKTTKTVTGSIDVYVGSEKITISCEKNKTQTTSISPTTTKSGKVKFVMTTTGKNLYLTSIAITYEEAETKCAAPTFTPALGYLELGNAITFTSATADAEVYYQYSYNEGEYTSFVKGTSFTPDKEGTYKIIAKATKTGLEDGVSGEQTYEVGNFVFNELFYESFDKNDGTGGNDDQWSGNIASNFINYDVAGWTGSNASGANMCARFGAGSTKGTATTPALAGLEGDAILTFKAAPWGDEGGKMTVKISNGTIEKSGFDLSNQTFTEYSVKISGGATSKITFTSSNNRFFLDEVKVVAIVKEPIIVKEPTATLGFTAAEINEMPWLAANDKVLTEETTEVKDASCVKLTCEEGAQIEYTLGSAENGSSTATVESGAEIGGLINGELYDLTVCAVKGGYKSASRKYMFIITGSTSSVSSVSAEGIKVVAAEGGVEVVAAEATDVAVYTVAGQLVRQARVAEGSTLVNVAPGFYVVRANGTATKVIVR